MLPTEIKIPWGEEWPILILSSQKSFFNSKIPFPGKKYRKLSPAEKRPLKKLILPENNAEIILRYNPPRKSPSKNIF